MGCNSRTETSNYSNYSSYTCEALGVDAAMEVDLCKNSSDGEDDYEPPSDDDVESIPVCIRHPGWTNVILVIAYGLAGIIFLTTQQGWQAETAFYVVVQIVTTIGFGDITVTKEEEAAAANFLAHVQ